MSTPHEPDPTPAGDPEQERVRRILADLAHTEQVEPPAMPPEVAARLETTLAGLRDERAGEAPATEELTAELPILALIFTRKFRPIAIGSDSGWFTLFGMMARPRAISSRTNSAVTTSGMLAPKSSPSRMTSRSISRRMFSRMATNSISGVTMPRRA